MAESSHEIDEPGPGGNEPSLGVLLLLPYRHMEQRILAAVVAAGFPITLAQARVFQRVDDRGSRLTELAEAAQLTKQSAAYLVEQLEGAGYLARAADPRDGRARLLTITDRGRRVIAVAREIQDQIEAEWTEHLGVAATEELRATLVRLREVTDPFRS